MTSVEATKPLALFDSKLSQERATSRLLSSLVHAPSCTEQDRNNVQLHIS